MNTLTIHPATNDQETAIRMFLDALHVDYKSSDNVDETTYLMSSPANAEHLQKSIEQGKKGEVTKLSLDDIWKP
ncbi:type II toxin-antitoxin system prevent-host-death family antitoxin [Mucilaginibacter mali]|uniref:Type II toxin-antitoxin system prevent-host-death family antitoxin n=1 Tax=Mucilaginibacter mali TaxID=2740462 RepID=A0A7D4PZY7_9SPHI|nr:DUF2683 family protein [Mucilaginibacter mali]QKJ28207.1 type II toxin-antitoxin system prevent-host-death family antitoxin [Mucilaginibacter mali]